MSEDYKLLEKLCSISAPSSDESRLSMFLINYVEKNCFSWRHKPKIIHGENFQDCVMLVFGTPRTAIFAHIDSVGFMVGYNKQLVAIGSPRCEEGTALVGFDQGKEVDCKVIIKDDNYFYESKEELQRGTLLTYKPDFVESNEYIESPFLDNRVGVYVALQLAAKTNNVAMVFSTGEENHGGNAQFCWRYLYKSYHLHNVLIADITWITEGIKYGKGCVVSLKDSNLPRKSYVDKILNIAKREKIQIQREVETAGGSDGGYLQQMPYAVNWCFVGAAQEFSHSPKEKIMKADIDSMYELYKVLIENL